MAVTIATGIERTVRVGIYHEDEGGELRQRVVKVRITVEETPAPKLVSRDGGPLLDEFGVQRLGGWRDYSTGIYHVGEPRTRVSIVAEVIDPKLRRDGGFIMSTPGSGAAEVIRHITASPLSDADRERLAHIAERWHLNDMRAGCAHQAGWDRRPIDPTKPTDTYGRHFEGQRQDSWNLLGWVRPSEHPRGLMGVPCAYCGYRYGTEWLYQVPPAEDVAFLRTVGKDDLA